MATYYQLVRFVALMAFLWLGYQAKLKSDQNLMFLYFGLAILFQPIIKISLGRTIWNVVDVIVGLELLASIFIGRKNDN
jgi:predicted membrane-bound mannosyltransferase